VTNAQSVCYLTRLPAKFNADVPRLAITQLEHLAALTLPASEAQHSLLADESLRASCISSNQFSIEQRRHTESIRQMQCCSQLLRALFCLFNFVRQELRANQRNDKKTKELSLNRVKPIFALIIRLRAYWCRLRYSVCRDFDDFGDFEILTQHYTVTSFPKLLLQEL